MPHDELMAEVFSDLNASENNWENKARALRGFLRVTRSGMEALIEEANPDTDWAEEYQAVVESINDILKEVA